MTFPQSSRLFFERLCANDKEYREYPEAYHHLHNDLCAQEVARDILNWLERQVNRELMTESTVLLEEEGNLFH